MTGISSTGLGLPSAQSLFTGGAATTTPAPASTAPVNGPTVAGPGGTTALPTASPADFQGVNPTPLDQPHPQYPTLIQSHVAVLQAIGTPESVIAQLAQSQPAADYLDRYIQGEIMQNPEGWDAYVGNPAGTARAGLQQLMPGVQLPSPGAGTPGIVPGQGRVDGINVPGVTQPLAGPEESAGSGIIKGIVIAAAIAGVGLLAWKFMKGRNPGGEAAQAAQAALNGGDDSKNILTRLASGNFTGDAADLVANLGSKNIFGKADEAGEAAKRLLAYQAVAGGGAGPGGTITAASLDAISRGFGPADGFLHSVGITAAMHNQPYFRMGDLALKSRMVGVWELAAKNGQLGELVAAAGLLAQHSGSAAQAGANASKLAGLQQVFAGVANAMT